MALFVIADLHLSSDGTKSMEKFGTRWTDYMQRIQKNWSAVVRPEDTVIVPGSCTNANLAEDGTILTDENGIAVFDGLRVYTNAGELIQYRVTETKTLNGSSLMPGRIWEGNLANEKNGELQFEVVLKVINSPILELPETGSKALALMPIGLALCAAVCMGALFVLKRKKEV